MEAYQKILKVEPNKADLHDTLASLLAKNKEFDEAINHYQKAIQLAPQNFAYRINLARVYENMGDLENALAEYKTVYKINPESQEAKDKVHDLNIEILRRKHTAIP